MESIKCYTVFKAFEKRILVTTDIFSCGIDVERVNIIVNYGCPPNADSYLHCVGHAGQFGKGLAITFVSRKSDQQVMAAIQSWFEVAVPEPPDHIDPTSYGELVCSILDSASCLFLLCCGHALIFYSYNIPNHFQILRFQVVAPVTMTTTSTYTANEDYHLSGPETHCEISIKSFSKPLVAPLLLYIIYLASTMYICPYKLLTMY